MKPDIALHNPCPAYLRGLLDQAGLTQVQAAERIGVSARMMRYYLADGDKHRAAPYMVQFALECLAR
jgi:transcriptional regulator with XRE-family HTH domain